MNFPLSFKLKSRHLTIVLGFLAFILIAMGLAGALGLPIPEAAASTVSNIVIISAIVIFFYNRKVRADEAKELREAEEKAVAVSEPESPAADAYTGSFPDGEKSPDNR